ncbi:MAG: NADH-quinone oxidoreductase subunit A [Dehalococcoidia bacterium]
MNQIFDNWSAVLIGSFIGASLIVVALIGNLLLAPKAPSRAKGTAYECGMLPIGRSVGQVHVRYYLFAILFLIFDVETVFLFPWAVVFRSKFFGEQAFYEMAVFLVLLAAGLVYAWKKGVLQWKQ